MDFSGLVTPSRRAVPKEEECSRLLAALRETGTPLTRRRYGRGDTIYRGSEEGRALYVLIEGVAKIFVSYPGYSGSKNGTFRGADRVTTPISLADGDEIRIGSQLVTFHLRAFDSTDTQTAAIT